MRRNNQILTIRILRSLTLQIIQISKGLFQLTLVRIRSKSLSKNRTAK